MKNEVRAIRLTVIYDRNQPTTYQVGVDLNQTGWTHEAVEDMKTFAAIVDELYRGRFFYNGEAYKVLRPRKQLLNNGTSRSAILTTRPE